ncbi:MAG: hypothetical protein JJU31_10165 [Wenzhouxiangella sp.]|nr:hypothetical protein [Wenzhouxiangella sp.]MCH8477202.1 hypothetical protein [Wenzhouxiangella sp.]TVR98831.1 MAG: hypothetical protein EA418_00800 [Wenzhouxiangellaceae bacterium]
MSVPERIRYANPWWRRLLRRWRQWRGGEPVKVHLVQIVDADGRRRKRVIFETEQEAVRVASCLRALKPSSRFPRLLSEAGRRLEVEFLAGPVARRRRRTDHAAVAEFFVDLYAGQTLRAADPAGLAWVSEFDKALARLHAAAWIDAREAERLAELARDWQPPQVWLGHEYIDPIARNFVINDQRAMAIDIEALWPDQPLGLGLAKAALRWLHTPPDAVLKAVLKRSGTDLQDQYPWVSLCFTALYFAQKLDQNKPGHIRIQALTGLGQAHNSKP